MDAELLHYSTGEEVHAGDRVQHDGNYAIVVFVNHGEGEEFWPGYEDYAGYERGVVVCDDDGSAAFLGEPDEMLAFVDRA